MQQVIPFDQSKGGNVHNMCLANVCAGYSIPNKYGSAREAWEHTQQHTDNLPIGLDVPVFFSYTAEIDGVTQNWGHIGVRLANGQFWSDGTLYNSIQEYESAHYPKYVGWGESINDVQIIKGGNDMFPNEGDLINFHNATGWPGHDLNQDDIATWTTGTGNDEWANGADAVWKALTYQVTDYVNGNPKTVEVPAVAPALAETPLKPPVTETTPLPIDTKPLAPAFPEIHQPTLGDKFSEFVKRFVKALKG